MYFRQISGAAAIGVAVLTGTGLSAATASAGYVVTLQQVGSDVVATGSGPIDLTGLSSGGSGTSGVGIVPNFGDITTGSTSGGPVDFFTGFTGPASFGSGSLTFADSGSGDIVGLFATVVDLVVPAGYVSGAALSDSATYDNQTFGSLGVTPGVYQWSWGSGANQSFTLDIGAAPEPSGMLVLALPLGLTILLAGGLSRGTPSPSGRNT